LHDEHRPLCFAAGPWRRTSCKSKHAAAVTLRGKTSSARHTFNGRKTMKQVRRHTAHVRYGWVAALVIAAAFAGQSPVAKAQGLVPATDILYVGDARDNTVKIFRADDGRSVNGANGAFVTPSGGLRGPRGLLIAGPELIVVDQNVNLPFGGQISQYQLNNGSFAGTWVPKNDPNAPFAPRGAVSKNGVLYVANFVDDPDLGTPGQVLAFAGNGDFLGTLAPPAKASIQFRPRGIVLGPDGLLYVSSDPNFAPGKPGNPTTGGQVLRFNPDTFAFVGVFIDDPGGPGQLNRPEGLVFGPNGTKLYVTSFRATTTDTDSIRIYDATGAIGVSLGKIDLDKVGQPRAFAQALLFGPGGYLFVPISNTGEVRKYNVGDAMYPYTTFITPGALGAPFYLTFGRTDSATLAYPDE
jgi:hypothetical protein